MNPSIQGTRVLSSRAAKARHYFAAQAAEHIEYRWGVVEQRNNLVNLLAGSEFIQCPRNYLFLMI